MINQRSVQNGVILAGALLLIFGLGFWNARWLLSDSATRPILAPQERPRPAEAELQKAHPWKSRQTKRIALYYPADKPEPEIAQIAQGLEEALSQATELLEVEPLPFPVSVYLFADAEQYGRTLGREEPTGDAYAHGRLIAIVYSPWEALQGSATHELCHAVVAHHFGEKSRGMLEEGLAEYVQAQVAPGSNRMEPKLTTETPLRTFARPEVFYDWAQAEESGESHWAHYAHAHAFVAYLMQRFGMERFKELYRNANDAPGKEESERLAEAVQQTFGQSLATLEREWRSAYAAEPPQ